MDETEHVLTQKVGPLPLVAWVVGASAVVFLFILIKGKGSANTAANNQTNSVTALAPTEAEAFGTMEQQQQDVTNALTTLGNNQSALGGSMSTLTGIVTHQGADNAAAFQNLLTGQQTIQQGQASAASSSQSYYQSLLDNLTNYYNSLGSQINGVNSNVTAQAQGSQAQANSLYQMLYSTLQNMGTQISGVSGQVGQVSSQQQANAVAQQYGFANTDALLAYLFYQMPSRYAATFPASVNASTNASGAEAQMTGAGVGTAQPGWSTNPT